MKDDYTVEEALQFYADRKFYEVIDGKTCITENGAVASSALKHLSASYLTTKGDLAMHDQDRALSVAIDTLLKIKSDVELMVSLNSKARETRLSYGILGVIKTTLSEMLTTTPKTKESKNSRPNPAHGAPKPKNHNPVA